MKANYISMEGNYTVTNGTQEDELNFLVTLSSLEDDYEDDYAEYFDIGHRAATFLRRPPYVLALTVGTVAALANIITILAIVQVITNILHTPPPTSVSIHPCYSSFLQVFRRNNE